MISTGEQLSKLVFCAAVFKEVARIHPVVYFLFFHSTVSVFFMSVCCHVVISPILGPQHSSYELAVPHRACPWISSL